MPDVKQISSSSNKREALLRQQITLLEVLVSDHPAPAQFDASRLLAAGRALKFKRCRLAAKAWPELVDWLGADFGRRFNAYAQNYPLPRHGGPLADGWSFIRTSSGPLPDAVRIAQIGVGLRYTWHRDGLHPRRGPACKMLLLRQPFRIVIGIRLPFVRSESAVRFHAIPLFPVCRFSTANSRR